MLTGPAGAAPGEDRFRWHPSARVLDAQGAAVAPLPAGGLRVIPDRPAAQALVAALAGAAAGFRVGGTEAPPPAAGDTPVFETLTGGTSGAPRRIRRTQASWIRSFQVNAGLFGIGPGTRVAVPGRLVHSLSLYAALEGVHLGAEVRLLDGLRPDRQARALAGAEVVYATPAQARQLADAGVDWPGLRWMILGGAAVDPGLRADIARRAPGAGVVEFYGAAETSFVALSDAGTPAGSVGRPYPGVEIRVGPPGPGPVWVKSPYLFAGYAGPPGGARCEDGWVSVGEWGWLDGGYLFLSGRGDRMVTIAGQNVFPEAVEACLASLPGVTRVAVIARPDGARGHVLHAVVMGDPARADEILRRARQHLGPLVAPRRLVWRADWPVLASGKTDYAALARGAP